MIGRGGTRIAPDDCADARVRVRAAERLVGPRHQAYEYQPLGPNLGKSFATTISPWVVTIDALRPFLVSSAATGPEPDPYLRASKPWGLDLTLEVLLNGHRDLRDRLCRHVLDVRAAASPT